MLETRTDSPKTPIDYAAFARDLDALLVRTREELGAEDLAHLRKIEGWGRACTAAGYATAWLAPNPLSMVLLSTGRVTRWAMIAHHVSHRGYDRVPMAPETRTSKKFAKGARRLVDWLDWIDPEAWNHEHNHLHHYRLGETADPDLVEHNVDWLRESSLPTAVKLAIVGFFAGTWKFTYYAPNTLRVLLEKEAKARGEEPVARSLSEMYLRPELWTRCYLPYAATQFGLVPLLFPPLGPVASANVLVNSLGAELLTNLHSFLVIVTNHAGEDMERFDAPVRHGKGEFYYRQVVGSTNFALGTDPIDFFHGFLNYQIEHHLFPDLPIRAYQRIQPEVEAICRKHGVPYVKESVFTRLRKTVDVMIGRASMKRSEAC